MTELADSFENVVDADLWEQAAAVGAGYMGASLAQTIGEGVTPFDLPNEVFGVGVAYAGYTFAPAYENEIAAGGAVYTLDSVAQRFGLKNRVTDLAEGGD